MNLHRTIKIRLFSPAISSDVLKTKAKSPTHPRYASKTMTVQSKHNRFTNNINNSG